MENVTPAVAFGAGLFSFLSPCVLPLVPVYIATLCGSAAMFEESKRRIRLPLFLHCQLRDRVFDFVRRAGRNCRNNRLRCEPGPPAAEDNLRLPAYSLRGVHAGSAQKAPVELRETPDRIRRSFNRLSTFVVYRGHLLADLDTLRGTVARQYIDSRLEHRNGMERGLPTRPLFTGSQPPVSDNRGCFRLY